MNLRDEMANRSEEIKAEIEALSPPDQLRLAAALLERKQFRLAHRIADRVTNEMGAVLALQSFERLRQPERISKPEPETT
jgi:hypothetical protein